MPALKRIESKIILQKGEIIEIIKETNKKGKNKNPPNRKKNNEKREKE